MKLKFAAALVGPAFAAALTVEAPMAQGETVPSGDGQNAAETLAGLTGRDRPEDVIYARRLVMTMIGSRANTLSLIAQPGAEYHADVVEEAFVTIGFLLEVFPHLFAPETNTMPEEDIGDLYATNARPVVWEDFDAFYARAEAASELAFVGLNADPGDAFINAVADLQAACDSCHADYRRTRSTYGIPIPPLDDTP